MLMPVYKLHSGGHLISKTDAQISKNGKHMHSFGYSGREKGDYT